MRAVSARDMRWMACALPCLLIIISLGWRTMLRTRVDARSSGSLATFHGTPPAPAVLYALVVATYRRLVTAPGERAALPTATLAAMIGAAHGQCIAVSRLAALSAPVPDAVLVTTPSWPRAVHFHAYPAAAVPLASVVAAHRLRVAVLNNARFAAAMLATLLGSTHSRLGTSLDGTALTASVLYTQATGDAHPRTSHQFA